MSGRGRKGHPGAIVNELSGAKPMRFGTARRPATRRHQASGLAERCRRSGERAAALFTRAVEVSERSLQLRAETRALLSRTAPVQPAAETPPPQTAAVPRSTLEQWADRREHAALLAFIQACSEPPETGPG